MDPSEHAQWTGPTYNSRIMEFLTAQLKKVQNLEKSSTSLDWFNLQIERAERMLSRHEHPFDLLDYHRTEDARSAVETICEELNDVLYEWRMQEEVGIEVRVPDASVVSDEQDLHDLLHYVLTEEGKDGHRNVPLHWELSKRLHWRRIKCVAIVSESELRPLGESVGLGGGGVVHKSKWEGTEVAIKIPKRVPASIEMRASCIREATVQASLQQNANVVQIHAATLTGWLVMELATSDLKSFCRNKSNLGWATRLKLAQQSAAGLQQMHSMNPPLVHSDVKSANFLVFKGAYGNEVRVKIGDFGLAFELTEHRSKTVRLGGGTLEWTAPELYDGKPATLQSDIFSLGVVLHEIVTGRKPYAVEFGASRQAVVIKMKVNEEAPCKVHEQDCPEEMIQLMRRCCSCEPDQRPTINDICSALCSLPTTWAEVDTSNQGLAGQVLEGTSGGCCPVALKLRVLLRASFTVVENRAVELASMGRKLAAVLRQLTSKMGIKDTVVQVEDSIPGSIVFPVLVQFVSEDAATLFKKKIQMFASALFDAFVKILPDAPRPILTIVEELNWPQAQMSRLQDELQIVQRQIGRVTNFMYSHWMLRFLRETISILRWNLRSIQERSVEDECRKDLSALVHMLMLALQLLQDHKFVDMYFLQSSKDTQMTVNRILTAVSAIASKWNMPGARMLPSGVPAEYRQHDRVQLAKHLAFVLGIGPPPFEAYYGHLKEAWKSVKSEFDAKRHPAIIPKNAIRLGNRLGGSVHEAYWKNRKVASRQVVPTGVQEMDVEEFATLYTNTIVQMSGETKYVVKVQGITRSGALVMDLAKCNLQQWYRSSCVLVAAKITVLSHAAEALLSLHNSGIVYVHVKSSNFLIFDQDAEDYEDNPVRLAILSSEDSDLDMAHSTIQTARWLPAELYEGEAPSMKTDVFSFGAVLYELVMEEVPYGRSSTEAEVLRAKQNRQQPFRIPQRVEQMWPQNVLRLMWRCCSHDPDTRPSMKEVHDCLLKHVSPSWPAIQEHSPVTPPAVQRKAEPSAEGVVGPCEQLVPCTDWSPEQDADPLSGHPRYRTIRFLSSDGYALVVLASDAHQSGVLVVVKLFVGLGDTIGNVQSIVTQHPHIIHINEVFDWQGALGLAMEFADRGNMQEFMMSHSNNYLDETTARFYFQQLVLAVDYCHGRGFTVGDITMQNLLLSSSTVAINDNYFREYVRMQDAEGEHPVLRLSNKLGMAVNMDPEQQLCYGHSAVGSILDYTAPEKLETSVNATSTDVWSCGVLLYIMLIGRFPFTGTQFNLIPALNTAEKRDICARMQASEYVIPPWVSHSSAEIIHACLMVNPDLRIDIEGIWAHPWFQTRLPPRASEFNIEFLEQEAGTEETK